MNRDRKPYSYRVDPEVPAFDDSRPLFVFDEVCVLCSGGAAWLMRHDREARIAFTPATGPIGAGLYRHYGLELGNTYLLVMDGCAFGLSEGYFRLAAFLGGWWRLAAIFRAVPGPLRDWAYRLLARNRYRWFGKAEACALLTAEQRSRLL